jgi:hypothetical protein
MREQTCFERASGLLADMEVTDRGDEYLDVDAATNAVVAARATGERRP